MKTLTDFFWWTSESYVNHYCLAETQEQALKQLSKYRQEEFAKKPKVLKWWV